MEYTVENKKLVPLSKVVYSSIIDVWGDIGKLEQRTTHWACRGLKKLYQESLPKVKHKVWLTVNSNTHTATLPIDFDEETFVGFVDENWQRHRINLNTELVDSKNVIDIPCDDFCPKCNQNTSICNELSITEEKNLIVIGDSTYEQTITKKLYPNGDYYLETVTPVPDINDITVISYNKTREFIVAFDLNPCGCLTDNPLNTANLIKFCPDIYCNYYTSCSNQCNTSYGSYRIFEETGLIQLDQRFPYPKVYIEYYGFIQKINGQYYVPMVAFETLVEWTKWKQIQNKLNVLDRTIETWRQSYLRERGNMNKMLGRISLSQIMQAIVQLPKFDFEYRHNDWYSCFNSSVGAVAATAAAANPTVNPDCCSTTTIINRTSFTLAVKVGDDGAPVNNTSSYQNNVLIGAIDLNYIFLAKVIWTIKDGDFTFNSATGTIDISPNFFFTGDSLIVNYNKNL